MYTKVYLVVSISLALICPSYQSDSSLFKSNCHPALNPEKAHYVIGYGSLINGESKNRTSPDTGLNIPVKILGFKRTWTARGYSNVSLSTTYLGADIDKDSYLNGVVFAVPNSEPIKRYDERERIYCRVNVPAENISILRGNISDDGAFPTDEQFKNSEFWIYVTIPNLREWPDDKYPIVQSYVDVFLSGCLQMEKKYGLNNYSDDCITLTQGWEYPWVNDRVHPRRPFVYQFYAYSIDKLIDRHVEGYHRDTYIERIHVGRSVNAAPQFDVQSFKIFGYAMLAVSRLSL